MNHHHYERSLQKRIDALEKENERLRETIASAIADLRTHAHIAEEGKDSELARAYRTAAVIVDQHLRRT